MSEQQHTQYYDKLLYHLNHAFLANLKTQQLYLDLKKNTRKLRFKSIKNIYNTLTESKADEVIYNNDKPMLLNRHVYNPKYTERTCWRLIQKLITKIAYFLTNQRGLGDLAPSILKAIAFTRNATQKTTHKASFVQFFQEVLDTLIAQNNLLEEKIYDLLIQRGYIYSIDQFYRMSRFESPNMDFIYTNTSEKGYQNQSQEIIQNDTIVSFPNQIRDIRRQRSVKRMLSVRKKWNEKNKQKFTTQMQSCQKQYQPNLSTQNVNKNEDIVEDDEDQSNQSDQINQNEKYNKMSHIIHIQVEKAVEEIINHQNYPTLLSNSEEFASNISSNGQQIKRNSREPFIKQIIKNLQLKNFKANQKYLVIDQKQIGRTDSGRKNSYIKKEKLKMKILQGKILKYAKNRSSIATALSQRLKQKIFKNQGLQQIQNLVARNLSKLQLKMTAQKKQENQKCITRKNMRLRTQVYEVQEQKNKNKFQRRSSNLHFLSNAFVFSGKSRFNKVYVQHKTSKFAPEENESSISSFKTLQNINPHKKNSTLRRSMDSDISKQRKGLFTNEKIKRSSNFEDSEQKIERKGSKRDKNMFNANLLELAAKKYNRYSTQGNNYKQGFQQFFSIINDLDKDKIFKITNDIPQRIKLQQNQPYLHHRKYETYDRLNRKIL